MWAGMLFCGFSAFSVRANPAGGSVAQGTASFNTSGSTLTIQTSANAFINWQSFNIGVGETTTFLQPSSSSLVWNQIHDANPSQILGNLNANGFVVLQNQSGFYIGGQASINTHGLIMTTAPIPMPDLSSGGAWEFDSPPPTASIINYGQINVAGGNPAFLIAENIQNNGTINAPGGNIGLYAGQQVLLSDRPDGRGLSATVTLPAGSVDNSGNLIADAGTIALHAQVVNQGGVVQANSVREVNGVIELVAGDSLNLTASSVISAKGDSQGTSYGGSVTLQSGNQYTDNAGSVIDVSGGIQGGNGGQIEISAACFSGIQSQLVGGAVSGWKGASLILDPAYIDLIAGSASSGSGSSLRDPLLMGVNSFAGMTQISIQASQNIELSTAWTLSAAAIPATLTLSAGNNIALDDGASINAGVNWSLSLAAGPQKPLGQPAAGSDGIYLNGGSLGGSYLQTQNGNISLWAANEVQIQASPDPGSSSSSLINGIRTQAGGNITVTALLGDVETGGNEHGYLFQNTAPYHSVSPLVGGISTAAGGNVTINAGGDVLSYLPLNNTGDPGEDAGTGAFGPEPGNVTINAGGSVYGHYVLANGIGTVTAQDNVGGQSVGDNVALSLIAGAWNLNAPNGNIYLQEVRNPNGVYNNTTLRRGATGTSPNHLFDYDPQASVTLNAGVGVEFLTTQANLPRLSSALPAIFPPNLYINAGSGGVLLDSPVTLFPSAYGELQINISGGGSLMGSAAYAGNTGTVELLMSDSALKNYLTSSSFSDTDHGPTPLEINDANPVVVNVSGNMNNIQLVTVKETEISVGGEVVNCSFSGQNLHPTDKTTITVAGAIYNSPSFSSVVVSQAPALVALQDLPSKVTDQFDTLLKLAVDPTQVAQLVVPAGSSPAQVLNYWGSLLVVGNAGNFLEPSGFAYDGATSTLSFLGQMSQKLINLLNEPAITVVRFSSTGIPEVDASGHFITDTYTWVDSSALKALIAETANDAVTFNNGLRIGGPGEFDINAGSIQLGNSYGILSVGAMDFPEGGLGRYANLASITPVGADLNVSSEGDIDLVTSTIASLAGGNVDIKSTGGEIDLGSADALFSSRTLPLGAFVTGLGGNINVSAYGNVNIDSSRVAAYDGGNITVNSETGNVNAGSGGATAAFVETHYINPVSGIPESYTAGIYGNGILATTLVDPTQVPGSPVVPGNITVTTPQGNIEANLGGILQEALNGSIAAGPTITLVAGTLPDAAKGIQGYVGNIDLGDSGVIGGTINLNASGNINGLIISRQNSSVQAAQNFTGTVLSGGSASVQATGSVSGTIVGIGGANVSGGLGVSAQVLGQSVSVNGGAATSTLGTTAAATVAATSASGTANTDAKQTLTTTETTGQGDDDLNKKKMALLTKLVGRVTVILP